MAQTRFRRKSHSKKNKTARRQKRQSKRVRGGMPIDKSELRRWANQHPDCAITVSAPGLDVAPKTFYGKNIQGKDFHTVKSMVKGMEHVQPYEIAFDSPCPTN
uniref:Uncharacterized protein n=1 Tax=viral metagenome TaxID=1070528 RepID=A0A6C0LRX9_9ZZZZ